MENNLNQQDKEKDTKSIYFQKVKNFLTKEHIKTASIIFLLFLVFCFICSDPEQENIRLTSKISGLESTSTNLQQTVDDTNKQIESLQQENSNLKNKTTELEAKVTQLDQEKQTLETEKSDLNTKITQLEQENQNLNSKIESSQNTTKTSSTSSSTTSSSKRSSNSSSSENTQSKTVYITKTGSKYHSSGCSYLSKSQIAISLSNAKSQGYTPCSRCNP